MNTDQLLAACIAILLLHSVAYYVFVALATPVTIPGHDTTLPAFTVQESE